MNRFICIHGHFYQPPRENPWLEDVELQNEAYPYHDWNERITEECYSPNAASRILNSEGSIIDIVNNYSKISFNFGPTLLAWLEKHAHDVYESIIEADKISQQLFSGHGAAIAQAYNHIIMPLANKQDKQTQVIWGIYDFCKRFGREPEGMWLPETAADLETLEILAEQNIKFTILSQHQAKRIRKLSDIQWQEIEGSRLDTRIPYLCKLPSGKNITLFFYNEPAAQAVAYGKLLESGEQFAEKLLNILDKSPAESQLANIATDGETYGHHHRYADMALAYCLRYIEANNLAKITIYGEYLEKFPPAYEVEIRQNTSWSCSHGIERWRDNCGCFYGRFPGGKQQWRKPLRESMDWLRDNLAKIYESQMSKYSSDPWQLRDKYISVILDRSPENTEKFLSEIAAEKPSNDEKTTILKLLEMQRNSLPIYTSCGWFFDDISGIETLQIMQYAARAMQLAREVSGERFEPEYKNILARATTNLTKFENGSQVYESLVQPAQIDLNRVGAHFAVSSLFLEYPQQTDIYCYTATTDLYDRFEAGTQILAVGRASILSHITLEIHPVDFAVLYFGDHNLICGVNAKMPDDNFSNVQKSLTEAFNKGDTTEVMRILNVSFYPNNYSLWHLFKDKRKWVLYKLLDTTWQEIDSSFRHIYEHNYSLMKMMLEMNMPLPKAFSTPAEFVLSEDLRKALKADRIKLKKLQNIIDEANRLSLSLDNPVLQLEARRKLNQMMETLKQSAYDVNLLETTKKTFELLGNIVPTAELRIAQNILFEMSITKLTEINKKAAAGDKIAKIWVELFTNLARQLKVKCND